MLSLQAGTLITLALIAYLKGEPEGNTNMRALWDINRPAKRLLTNLSV